MSSRKAIFAAFVIVSEYVVAYCLGNGRFVFR